MEASFRALGTDRVDLMQVHNLINTRENLALIREWKEQGRIRYVGVTHFRESANEELAEVMRSEQLDFVPEELEGLDVVCPETDLRRVGRRRKGRYDNERKQGRAAHRDWDYEQFLLAQPLLRLLLLYLALRQTGCNIGVLGR